MTDKQHGGKRQGAGRPKSGRGGYISAYLDYETLTRFSALRERLGLSMPDALREALREWIDNNTNP